MNNNTERPRFHSAVKSVHKVNAEYHPAIIPSHRGNPNLEALPPILDESAWMDRLVRYPDFDPSLRSLPVEVRFNLLEDIRRLYQPLDIPLRLAMDFDTLLRSGYVNRSPFSADYRRNLLEKRDGFEQNFSQRIMDEYDNDGLVTSGLTIKGLSGVGKTRTINRILARYPQVIKHTEYKGKPCFYSQIVFMKFDCPPHGTLRAFAEDGLLYLDEILGSDYYPKFKINRFLNTNHLLRAFLNIATEHYLGVLILDEIGNLFGAKEGRIIQNTLIMMSNDFNIPVILIGNPLAERILDSQFRQMRRSYGYDKYNNWLQMGRDDDDWVTFCETLWKYQYVKNQTKLTANLLNKLHGISGGVTDLAIKMFISAQKRAMRDGGEEITTSLLQFVANEEFAWARNAVQALSLGTEQALKKYEDLYTDYKKLTRGDMGKPIALGVFGDRPSSEVSSCDNKIEPQEIEQPISSAQEVKAKGKKKHLNGKTKEQGLLAQLVIEGRKNNQTAYQVLKDTGIIVNIQDYL